MYPSVKMLKCLTSLVNKLAARKWWHLNVIPLGSCFFNLFSHWKISRIHSVSLLGFRNQSATSCWPRRGGAMAWSATTEPGGIQWGWRDEQDILPPPKHGVVNGHKQETIAETMCRLIWSKTSSLEVFIWLEVGASLSGYLICMSLNGFRLESWHWGHMMQKCKRDRLYSSRFQHRCEGVDGSPLPAPHSHRFIAVRGDSPQDKDEITIW